MRLHSSSRWRLPVLSALFVVAASAMLVAATVRAQSLNDNLDRLDRLAERAQALVVAPGFDPARLSSVGRNLTAFAALWDAARNTLAPAAAPAGGDRTATAATHGVSRPVSQPSLTLSRYAGFTQSQTSTAWCGASVLTAFNDTGSEIRTLAGATGISVVGLSTSSSHGASFSYLGTPAPAIGFYQALLGAPAVVCADNSTFFYSAIWSDTQADVTGVALAKSTDGGVSFASPALAVSKSVWTNLIDHDSLAIDPDNHSA
ncbi:MAG: hypothetical protein ACRETD_04955, partial [Steroidobacteraceae bacterium]